MIIDFIKECCGFRNEQSVAISVGYAGALFLLLSVSIWFISILFMLAIAELSSYVLIMGNIVLFPFLLGFVLLIVYVGLSDRVLPQNDSKINQYLLLFARWWRENVMSNKSAKI